PARSEVLQINVLARAAAAEDSKGKVPVGTGSRDGVVVNVCINISRVGIAGAAGKLDAKRINPAHGDRVGAKLHIQSRIEFRNAVADNIAIDSGIVLGGKSIVGYPDKTSSVVLWMDINRTADGTG